MKKIYRINPSKEPSLIQLVKMSFNLREKFKKASVIDIRSTAYSSTRLPEISFWLWIDGKIGISYISWRDCQNAYFSLMKEKTNE